MSKSGTFPVLISGYSGLEASSVHPAPSGCKSLFFSNNKSVLHEARLKGWKAIRIPNPQVSSSSGDAEISSSLSAKAFKFLQLSPLTRRALKGQSMLYLDHKFKPTRSLVDAIVGLRRQDADILVFDTPSKKSSIHQEVSDAMGQYRYSKAMPNTRAWMRHMIRFGLVKWRTRIARTGIIYYANPRLAFPFSSCVFNVCMALNQPECQIIWAALAQHPSAPNIQIEDWDKIDAHAEHSVLPVRCD